MSVWRAVVGAVMLCGCGASAAPATIDVETPSAPDGDRSAGSAKRAPRGVTLEGSWRCHWSTESVFEELVVKGPRFTRVYQREDAEKCSIEGSFGGTKDTVEMQEETWSPDDCTPPSDGQGLTHHRVVTLEADKLVLTSNLESGGDLLLECVRQ